MSFPMVALGEVLKRVERFEERDDLEEFHFAGTYSFARGIFAGEKKFGSTFKLDKIQRIHAGDFVYCKIMAWEGAFGIVPTEAHNCVMSGAFVVYEVDKTKIDPVYLDFYFKISRVWKSIGGQSTGTNIRRRSLHPNQFESAKIPLPPLAEQRRIVSRIEELAAKIEEARGLRRNIDVESDSMITAALRKVFCTKEPKIPLGEVLQLQRGFDLPIQQRIRGSYPVFAANGEIDRHIESRVKGPGVVTGRSGSVGAVNYVEEDFWPLNTALYVRDFKGNSPRLIYYLLRAISPELKQASSHTAVPTLDRKKAHSQIHVHIPPLPEQRRIVTYLDALQAKVDSLRRLQEETGAELDALLPAVLDRAFKGEL